MQFNNSDAVMALIGAVIIGLVVFFSMIFVEDRKKPDESEDKDMSAPPLYGFRNPVTFSILMTSVVLIVSGAGIIYLTSSIWGVVIGVLGAAAMWLGKTDLPADTPRTAGALKLWNRPLCIGGRRVVVGGTVFLADYFPFYIGCTPVEITNDDRDFPMTIISEDTVVMEGSLSLTFRPSIYDLTDFLQATGGKGMTPIFNQIDDIALERFRNIAAKYNHRQIMNGNQALRKEIEQQLQEICDSKSFGIEVVKANPKFNAPIELRKRMEGAALERYDRINEGLEYETDLINAKKLYDMKKDINEPATLTECLNTVMQMRLMRDKRTTRIETTGKTVTIADADIPGKGATDSNN